MKRQSPVSGQCPESVGTHVQAVSCVMLEGSGFFPGEREKEVESSPTDLRLLFAVKGHCVKGQESQDIFRDKRTRGAEHQLP